MKTIAACMMLAAVSCHAQTNDKALHMGASAGIGLVLRNTMDSKHEAFLLTLAAGAAKEARDSRQPGNRFDGRDMLANAIGAALAVYTPVPDEVGIVARSWHPGAPAGAFTDNTPGIYGRWTLGQIGPVRASAVGSVLRLSTGDAGAMAGGMFEYGWASLMVGGVYGYKAYEYRHLEAPGRVVCRDNFCASVTERTVLRPMVSLGARVDLPGKWVARLQYQPKATGDQGPLSQSLKPRSKAVSLLVGRSF